MIGLQGNKYGRLQWYALKKRMDIGLQGID